MLAPLGDAAAAAAFEVQCIAGGRRGLKADLAVRRQWTSAYASADRIMAPSPVECARA